MGRLTRARLLSCLAIILAGCSSVGEAEKEGDLRTQRVQGWAKIRKGLTPEEVASLWPCTNSRRVEDKTQNPPILKESRQGLWLTYRFNQTSGQFGLDGWAVAKLAYPELFPKETAAWKASFGETGIRGWGDLRKGMTVQQVSEAIGSPKVLAMSNEAGGISSAGAGTVSVVVRYVMSMGNSYACKFTFDRNGLIRWANGGPNNYSAVFPPDS